MDDRALVFLVLVGVGVGGAVFVARRRAEAMSAASPSPSPVAAAEGIAPAALTAGPDYAGGGFGYDGVGAGYAAGELMPAVGFEAGGMGSVQFNENPMVQPELTARGTPNPDAGRLRVVVAKPAAARPQPKRVDADGTSPKSRLLKCYECCGGNSKCRKGCEFLVKHGDNGDPYADPARKCWGQANAR